MRRAVIFGIVAGSIVLVAIFVVRSRAPQSAAAPHVAAALESPGVVFAPPPLDPVAPAADAAPARPAVAAAEPAVATVADEPVAARPPHRRRLPPPRPATVRPAPAAPARQAAAAAPPRPADPGPAAALALVAESLEPAPFVVPHRLSHVVARLQNRMGATYVLLGVACELDGELIFERHDAGGALDRMRDLAAFDRMLEPGHHTLVVRLSYRGSGFGVFKYLEGYRFDARSDYTFTTSSGHRTDVVVAAVQKHGGSAKMEDRLQIKFSSRSSAEGVASSSR